MTDGATHPVKLGGVHHTALRCKDAKETVEWYGRVLGMDYTTAFAEDHVPSTGAYDPYMHVFLDAGNAWGPEGGGAGYDQPRLDPLAGVGAEVVTRLSVLYSVPLLLRIGGAAPLVDPLEMGPRFYVRLGGVF